MQNSCYAAALLDSSGRFSPEKFLECFIKAANYENLSYPINHNYHETYPSRTYYPPYHSNKIRYQQKSFVSPPAMPPLNENVPPAQFLNDSTEFEVISSESENDSDEVNENTCEAVPPPTESPFSTIDKFTTPYANRLKLVLDLDNTLLHACARFKLGNCDISLEDFISSSGHCELFRFTLPSLPDHIYYLKLRPGVHQFIEKVSKYCDLAIHTNATQEYAEIVKTILDPDGRYIGNRLVARNNAYSCDSKKDIDRLFGSNENFTLDSLLILDDRMDVWDPMYHGNIIHCGMYDYLDSRKQALNAKYPNIKNDFPSNNQQLLLAQNQEQHEMELKAKQLPNITANQPSDYVNMTEDEPFSDNPLVELSKKSSDDTEDCEDTILQSDFDIQDNSDIPSNPFLQENALVDYDVELTCIADLIENIAKQYYENCQPNAAHENNKIHNILKAVRTNILKDTIVQTTGMYKLESSHPEHGWHDNGPVHRKRLLALGATVVQTTIPELTHLLVMRATQTLDMIRSDKSYNVHFVHALWLHACESTWSRIPESWFEAFPLLRLYENNPPKKPWVDIWKVLAQQKDWKYNPSNTTKSSPITNKTEPIVKEIATKLPSLNNACCWSPFEILKFVYKTHEAIEYPISNYNTDMFDIPPFNKTCKRRRKVEVAN